MPSKTGRVGASAPDFVIAEGSEESPTPASDAAQLAGRSAARVVAAVAAAPIGLTSQVLEAM